MQLSRYNVIIPDEPLPGSVLIFNTLTGALYELEPEYCATLQRLRSGQDLLSGDEARLEELATEGFVVADAEAEQQRVIHQLRTASYTNAAILQAIVVTTMGCNLACHYCMESGMGATPPMTADMAALVAEKLVERVEQTAAAGVAVDFYGGEPLLNRGCIHFLAVRMQKWARDHHKSWTCSMTTNGTLLTPEVVEELLPLGLQSVRVSMDGIREVHDARRPFRSGQGSSFDAVIANLRDVVGLLPITLNMTLSRKSLAHLPAFLDMLDAEGILHRLAAIAPGIEQPFVDKEGRTCGTGQVCIHSEETAEDYCNALRLLVARGISPGSEILQGGNCSLMMNSGILVFSPDGFIYKCPSLMGKPEWAIGQLDAPRLDDRYYELVNRELWRPCLDDTDCPYLPMCGSAAGCRYAAMLQHGDWMADACSRRFFDKALPEWMLMEYMKTMQTHMPEGPHSA